MHEGRYNPEEQAQFVLPFSLLPHRHMAGMVISNARQKASSKSLWMN